MKFNYKKIAALSTSVLLTSMTLGIASAVSYPSEFSEAGNAAVVYGADAASTDQAQASNINEDLGSIMSGGAATVGEESFLISATGNELNLGEDLKSLQSKLDEDELPTLLAEGTIEEDESDDEVDYDLELQLSGNNTVGFDAFSDEDYYMDSSGDDASKVNPVVNIDQENEAYRIVVDFDENIDATDMDDQSIDIAGESYTLDPNMASDDGELTLFKGKETVTIVAGDSVKVGGDTVEVIGGNTDADPATATISINGKQHQVEAGDKEEEYYVNDVFAQTVPEKAVSVELFVGTEEITIEESEDFKTVEVEGEDVDGVEAKLDNEDIASFKTLTFRTIPGDMDSDEKRYLEIGESFTDPLFKNLQMIFDEANPEIKSEDKSIVDISGGSDLKLKFTSRNGVEYDITPMTSEEIGENDEYTVLAEDNWYVNPTSQKLEGLTEDDIFITSEGEDSSEETVIFQIIDIDDDEDEVTFKDISSGKPDTVSVGDQLEDTGLYLGDEDNETGIVGETIDLYQSDGSTHETYNNYVVTENGMEITINRGGAEIDVSSSTASDTVTINSVTYDASDVSSLKTELEDDGYVASENTTSNVVTIKGGVEEIDATENVTVSEDSKASIALEEDRNADVEDDQTGFDEDTLDLTVDSDDNINIAEPSEVPMVEDDEGDYSYGLSNLGTYMTYDKEDRESLKVLVSGEETTFDVYFSSSAEGEAAEGGSKVYTDDESASYEGKNVVIVGGSCINAAAAEALGVVEGTCEADFTDATGVGEGEFLIQKVENYPEAGKTAIVVAGYSADDTRAAAETLINQDVELSTDGEVYSAATKEVVTSE